MTSTLSGFNLRNTPQTQQADPRQTRNNAGGYVFTVTPEQRLRRFLTLGTDGGTYYSSSSELTRANGEFIVAMAQTDHNLLLDTILDVSTKGLAPKQQPTLFALAIACSYGERDERVAALTAISDVCRTGTMLFEFIGFVEQFRGWGRGLRKGVAAWYEREENLVSFQAAKYRQRDGWTHRDVMRLSHPSSRGSRELEGLYDTIMGRPTEDKPRIFEGLHKAAQSGADIPQLIAEYGLTWEMLPTEALNERSTWEALLDRGMPITALIRQLPRLTNLGMLSGRRSRLREVTDKLTSEEVLRKGRVHPMNVLVAQLTYANGMSERGKLTWDPVRGISDALDEAFYRSFGAVQPSGKRMMLALDVSGSMDQQISGMPMPARQASVAMAMIQAATEPEATIVGFTSRSHYRVETALTPLDISPRRRLDDNIRTVSRLPFGGTDCALPVIHAMENGLEIDTFVVYTDNETWDGGTRVHQALRDYRAQTGIPARMVVVGMTATECSIADPSDPGMLDVAGFDLSVPNLINGFARGDI